MDFDWEERIGMEMEMETGGAGTPETGEKGPGGRFRPRGTVDGPGLDPGPGG
jgi:hypothetical protein